jgi:hypothetical protein
VRRRYSVASSGASWSSSVSRDLRPTAHGLNACAEADRRTMVSPVPEHWIHVTRRRGGSSVGQSSGLIIRTRSSSTASRSARSRASRRRAHWRSHWSDAATTSGVPQPISPPLDPKFGASVAPSAMYAPNFGVRGLRMERRQTAWVAAMSRRIATTSGCWRMPISSGDESMIDASPDGDVPASAAVRSHPIAMD